VRTGESFSIGSYDITYLGLNGVENAHLEDLRARACSCRAADVRSPRWSPEDSNPSRSTIQFLSFRTSRRIDRNPRVCARFPIAHRPGECLLSGHSPETSESYLRAILLGPSARPLDGKDLPGLGASAILDGRELAGRRRNGTGRARCTRRASEGPGGPSTGSTRRGCLS
jgi:hypothetical protein